MIEFARAGYDRSDLPLLGQQKVLKLARPHGCIHGEVRLLHDGVIDLLGDRVQPPDALARGGVSTGNHISEHTVGFRRGAMLTRQG